MSGSNDLSTRVTGPGTDADEERLARACVARHARDVEDERVLLAALGLTEVAA